MRSRDQLEVTEVSTPATHTPDAETDAGPVRRRRPSPGGPHLAEHHENGRGTGIVAALSTRHGMFRHYETTTRRAVLHVTA
jgi:hypothetical protein